MRKACASACEHSFSTGTVKALLTNSLSVSLSFSFIHTHTYAHTHHCAQAHTPSSVLIRSLVQLYVWSMRRGLLGLQWHFPFSCLLNTSFCFSQEAIRRNSSVTIVDRLTYRVLGLSFNRHSVTQTYL